MKYQKGFSLVEILVAVSILAVIAGLSTTMVSSVLKLIENNKRPIQAAEHARILFNLLESDIQKMFIRQDMSYKFDSGVVNTKSSDDFIKFYSDQSAFGVQSSDEYRGISLVGYRWNSSSSVKDKREIQRGIQAIRWRENDFFGIIPRENSQYSIKSLLNFTRDDYQMISRSILKVGIEFQYSYFDGNQTNINPDRYALQGKISTLPPVRQINRSLSPDQNIDPFQVSGLLVTLLCMDDRGVIDFTQQDLDDFLVRFEETSSSQKIYSQWNTILSDKIDKPIQKRMASHISIYQRLIPFPRSSIK